MNYNPHHPLAMLAGPVGKCSSWASGGPSSRTVEGGTEGSGRGAGGDRIGVWKGKGGLSPSRFPEAENQVWPLRLGKGVFEASESSLHLCNCCLFFLMQLGGLAATQPTAENKKTRISSNAPMESLAPGPRSKVGSPASRERKCPCNVGPSEKGAGSEDEGEIFV